jgi:DNA repair protein RecN (Recombination protein N)
MLKHLSIQNFAIIDHLELDFHPGLTVLTGETGAGKSILIDAIALLLGDRASLDMIRFGSDSAIVEAEFVVQNARLRDELLRMGLHEDEDVLVIRRELSSKNKSLIQINKQNVTLSDLKMISVFLADIHSQFDTQRLINPQNYLELIDGFNLELTQTHLDDYRQSLSDLRQAIAELDRIIARNKAFLERKEVMEFQLNELHEAHLTADEYDQLRDQAKTLENFDRVREQLTVIHGVLSDSALTQSLYAARNAAQTLKNVSQEFMSMEERLSEHYYDLEDMGRDVYRKIEQKKYDPFELERIHERLFMLESLKKKYRLDIAALIELQVEIETMLSDASSFDVHIEQCQKRVDDLFRDTIEKADKLSKIRQEIALKIAKELKFVLSDLGLAHFQIEIAFHVDHPESFHDVSRFSQSGIDQIDFLISTNLGEPLKPLAKTASGGEMSRVMLGFKTIFIRSQKLSTMIFDEIDTGISGPIATQIARKMRQISENTQVLSITHIPQVVAKGMHHIHVEKHVRDGRTQASASYLNFDARISEIAKMISGDRLSPSSLENAKELLLNS